MALYHVHADVISKGQAVGGSAGFARYITRMEGHATSHAAYIGRESHPGKDDLVEKGYGGPMPRWIRDGVHFFQMADRYSHKTATIARVYELALPREMDTTHRAELAADIRATFFERFPHVWAIHNPIDTHGLEHPHMHLMLSERRPMDTIERGPTLYFKYAAREGRDPATGGVGVDRSWHGKARLHELREGIAILTNAALERSGYESAVSHQSHYARGVDRAACVYKQFGDPKDIATVRAARTYLHEGAHRWENDCALATWDAQKAHAGIRDISREAMIDHARDHFWRHDHSPAREQERAASLDRAIAREYARTPHVRVSRLEREAPARPPLRTRERTGAWGHDGHDLAHGGVQVRLERGLEVER